MKCLRELVDKGHLLPSVLDELGEMSPNSTLDILLDCLEICLIHLPKNQLEPQP